MVKCAQEWRQDGHLDAANASWVDATYEQWLRDAHSVPRHWARYFGSLPGDAQGDVIHRDLQKNHVYGGGNAAAAPAPGVAASGNVQALVHAYRSWGYQHARLDPLELHRGTRPAALAPAEHGFGPQDMDQPVNADCCACRPPDNSLRGLLASLEHIYCGHIGAEIMHLASEQERSWWCERLEARDAASHYGLTAETQLRILERLVAAEGLSQYLAAHYPGVKRFDLEGAEALIPLLDALIVAAGGTDICEIVLGMAHRGRLSVLVNIMGKSPADLFDEFEGKYSFLSEDATQHKAGDVKYHQGFSSNVSVGGRQMHLALAFNPSHLEMVVPVVQGSVRARQERRRDSEGDLVLPVAVHGDAAFAGQGIVMESFQMSNTRAHKIGGTVHLVLNNQIGFTTSLPQDARSAPHCTDAAKILGAPVLHVNGDDPEAVVAATQWAVEYRNTFKKDVVLDLVCYRRYGHNEADEPAITQPMMYRKIKAHPALCGEYGGRLAAAGLCDDNAFSAMRDGYRQQLQKGQAVAPNLASKPDAGLFVDWSPYNNDALDAPCDTTLPAKVLRAVSKAIYTLPADFNPHPIVKKLYQNRTAMMAGDKPMDWGLR